MKKESYFLTYFSIFSKSVILCIMDLLVFLCIMDLLVTKSAFFFQKKDKAEIIRISEIINCRPPLSPCFFYPTYVIPHVSFILVFQVPAK